MDETAALVTHYMGNAKMIRETMEGIGFECHGGQVRNPASILKRKSAVNIPHGEFLTRMQTFLDFEMTEIWGVSGRALRLRALPRPRLVGCLQGDHGEGPGAPSTVF